MQQYLVCNKNCINFGIKLDADISIWMQSIFKGFDFSATLRTHPEMLTLGLTRPRGKAVKILHP